MVAVNVCYYVGARDEAPDRTGFAHLFEHLMFGGSQHAPDFDEPLQLAGGENNAFTNNDITDFYEILPAENLELALWLESDRMINLRFSEKNLEKERRVVVEEFKETCLNEPYGDVWHHLADLAYKVHPYRWPTIGKVPRHVEEATLGEVKAFYRKYYRPNNAVLTVAGPVKVEEVKALVEKWFSDIPSGPAIRRQLPAEPQQQILQQRILHGQAPADALYLAFHVPSRLDPDFYSVDLLSDVLGNGSGSRLYQRLLKDQQLVSFIDCYITGTIDPGLLIIEAKPAEGVTLEAVRAAVWEELRQMRDEPLGQPELTKLQNKVETNLLLSEATALNKAINLAFFEILGNVELINQEPRLYRQVRPEDVQRLAISTFTEENCSALFYTASQHTGADAA